LMQSWEFKKKLKMSQLLKIELKSTKDF
jgi:hypothetical protein